MGHVFISYARLDRAKANAVASALEAAGVDVWLDERLRAGSEFDASIEQALAVANKVLVLWSPASADSRWVRAEAGEGLDRGILIPVLVEQTKVPLEFRRIQTLDLIAWNGDSDAQAFRDLLSSISEVTTNGRVTDSRHQSSSRGAEAFAAKKPSAPVNVDAERVERLRLAVGVNAPFYLQSWATMDRRKSRISWNWAAFFSGLFFPGLWPSYRKMWGLASILFFLEFIDRVLRPDWFDAKLNLMLTLLVYLALGTILGMFGNWLYRSQTMSLVEATQYSNMAHDVVRRGGVSRVGLAVFVVAYAALEALDYYGWLKEGSLAGYL